MPKESNRVVYPPEGWRNPLTAEYVGPDRFGNGQVYDARLPDAAIADAPVDDAPVTDAPVDDAPVDDAPSDNAPLLRLVHDARDEEITVRCLRCPPRSQADGRFLAHRMIGIISVNATALLVPMNTPRIIRHLADAHQETLNSISDLDFFNSVLDCCEL